VADLVRAAADTFIERNRHWLRWKHSKVLLAIRRCRTAALGGHLDECTRCESRTAFPAETGARRIPFHTDVIQKTAFEQV